MASCGYTNPLLILLRVAKCFSLWNSTQAHTCYIHNLTIHPKLTWQTDTCTVLMLPCNRCHVCQLIDNIYGVDCLRQLYYTKWWCSNNAKVLTLLSGMLHQLISYKAQSIVWIKGKTSFLTKPSKHSRPTTCMYFIGSHTQGHIDSR